MLLKDLEINLNNLSIMCTCDVIIKRDGKHYKVPVNYGLEWTISVPFSLDVMSEVLQSFIETCNKISESWIIAEPSGNSRLVLQEEIEL